MAELISKEKVFDSLLDGFEVLHISTGNLNDIDGYALTSNILSRRIFSTIENIVKNATKDDLFIKIERKE